MREKNALNPPIVTVLGGGIAGLTAAHELVERGFLVQVVEGAEDPDCPGRPLVGGMAANQPARVRANLEDLHGPLLDAAAYGDEHQAEVARCLLELFAFNRRTWLATEVPERMHRVLYNTPDASADFTTAFVHSLKESRTRYRKRWLWDLTVRSVLAGDIRPRGGDDPPADERQRQQDRELLSFAAKVYGELANFEDLDSYPKLAERLHAFALSNKMTHDAFKSQLQALVVPALEREFLCFRLVPRVRKGFEQFQEHARDLFVRWCHVLAEHFPGSCLSRMEDAGRVAVESTDDGPALFEGSADGMVYNYWIELVVVEQRLPGEHGFRFFPSFYRHVDDTMRRIPLFRNGQPTGRTVLSNLTPTMFQGIGFAEGEGGSFDNSDHSHCPPKRDRKAGHVVELKRNLPTSFEGLRDRTDRLVKRLGGNRRDAVLLFARLLRFMSTSSERRRVEYENRSWSEFLRVNEFSEPMQHQINSAAQVLVSFSVNEADARTYGNIALQLLFDQLKDPNRVDRTLTGPTSDAWLEPWREYLERQGVRFFCRTVDSLKWHRGELVPYFKDEEKKKDDGERVVSQDGYEMLTHHSPHPGMRPDFYVLALNFEETHRLIETINEDSPPERNAAEAAIDFKQVKKFWEAVNAKGGLKHMTGLQFFFDAKTSLGNGHMYFPLSPWGLSSISQTDFWSDRAGFADGYFGVLSVGICSPGRDPAAAAEGKEGQNAQDELGRPIQKPVFWEFLFQGDDRVRHLASEEARHFVTAREVWSDIKKSIGTKDVMGEPRCFHIDQNLLPPLGEKRDPKDPLPRFSKFLASLAGAEQERPGRSKNPLCVGSEEIKYSLNHKRWVLCSTFMATHTRLTTMEAANESARHAVKAILRAVTEAEQLLPKWPELSAYAQRAEYRPLEKQLYNGPVRTYDPPDLFNPEDHEMEDLEMLRRIDRRLLALGLDHFLDIVKFDRKLLHALEGAELFEADGVAPFEAEDPRKQLVGSVMAGLDSLLLTELGRNYDQAHEAQVANAAKGLAGALPAQGFEELKRLVQKLVDATV